LHLRCLRSVGYLTCDVEPAIDYAKFYSRSHNAVIRVYDAARNMIEVHERVSLREGVDAAHKGEGVLYFSRLVSKLTQSHLPKIVALSAYQSMTIRNWNTTTKLLALMEHSNKDYLHRTIQS
jgi:uncharacterized protein (DUF1697 family)